MSTRKTESNSDGSWYSGTPLWVLAEQQGMRSACLFWPGSEAEIQGKRPSYYLHFDDKLDDEKRVDQVVAWLKLPPELRPHFITLYYSNVDHAGTQLWPGLRGGASGRSSCGRHGWRSADENCCAASSRRSCRRLLTTAWWRCRVAL